MSNINNYYPILLIHFVHSISGDNSTIRGLSLSDDPHMWVITDWNVRFFFKSAWIEILSSIYTSIQTIYKLYLDVELCLSYYQNGDMIWFALMASVMISSNLICFGMIHYSSKFDFEVVIDDKEKPHLGLINFIKQTFQRFCCRNRKNDDNDDKNTIKTYYHVVPNYRVFYFNDDAIKDITLNQFLPIQSLKFNGALLPFLALFNLLPTYLNIRYLKWRYDALASLRKDGHHYHKKMVKCVFAKNILAMVSIVSIGERAFQLFLQSYIVTQANVVSPLQLKNILVGLSLMLISCVAMQTKCSFMSRNLWDNGFSAYVVSIGVYIATNLLALLALLVIFITAAIYYSALAFISFGTFLVFVLSFFTRGILIKFRPKIVLVAKISFLTLFAIFAFSNYKWQSCMTNFNGCSSMDYKSTSPLLNQSYADINKSLHICAGGRIKACNWTAIDIEYSGSLLVSKPFICVSDYYEHLYYVINLIPYVILLFGFLSPLHKGFAYFYDYKDRLLPRKNQDEVEGTMGKDMEKYYSDLRLECPVVHISIVNVGQKCNDDENALFL